MKSLPNFSKKAGKRAAISPILATIILIVITVVVGVMLYGFVTGFFSSSSTSMDANIQTQLTIPAGASKGTFVVTINNAGTVAIKQVNIQLSGQTGPIANATVTGIDVAPGQSATFTATSTGWTASQGSVSNAGSTYNMSSANIISGESYNYIITITFANGGVKTYTGAVTASSF